MIVIALFLSVWVGVSFPLSFIASNSMDPALVEGDIVAWMPTGMEDVEIGDVVVFKSYIKWPSEKLIVHRVIDIKRDDATGSLMLETKGDANEWKDQNGPYLQAPYIRDDHLLGKAICIGQQPLKIPLIGYIGLWVNEGFDLLVQPTSSIGIHSYIAVFMSLTAFAMLLIFVVPEKVRAFKEKTLFFKYWILND
ncbi:signal peptidase I [Thermoplasmatales archaeon SCGC AB-540-F20]|nr:signal peptidase I [Thermoplasmatales archaeon SCGC AB-540-F20]